jgi:hypothetical protein
MDNQYNPNNYNPYSYGTGQQQGNNPYYPRRPYDPNSEPMELKDWIITFLLLMIPFANLILPFVWAFGENVNRSKKTFFQAYLIFMLISFIMTVIIVILCISVFASIGNTFSELTY